MESDNRQVEALPKEVSRRRGRPVAPAPAALEDEGTTRALDKTRLTTYAGAVHDVTLAQMDKAIKLHLAID